MLALLLVSASLVAASSAACTAAQMDTIGKCYADYNKAYGINDQPPLGPDYFEDFHRKRSDMMNKDSIAAKPAIAQYGAALTECLKPVADCIVDSTYEQTPLSCNKDNGDGHRFNLDRVQTAYECTEPGYGYQMRHFYCIEHFKSLDSTTSTDPNRMKLTQCGKDYNAAIDPTKNPSDDDLCKAYQAYTACYRDVFAGYCGSDEAGEFYCMLVSQEYRLWAPTCAFDCKKH